jgi:hypothetical protein
MDVQKKYKMTNSEGNSAGAGGALVSVREETLNVAPRSSSRRSRRRGLSEEGFLKEGFLLAAEDSMSSGFGHQTPTGRCFPVFMVRRPGLERQRSCSRDFQR